MSDNDTKIHVNLAPLAKLRSDLAQKIAVRIGIRASSGAHTLAANKSIQGKKASPVGLGSIMNVTLGVIHEFGSETANIPPRSFLRMPIESHTKDLTKFMQTPPMKRLMEAGNVAQVYKLLGAKGEAIIAQAFATGGFGRWQRLKAATVRAKGSSAILQDTGQLRRSVSSWVAKV